MTKNVTIIKKLVSLNKNKSFLTRGDIAKGILMSCLFLAVIGVGIAVPSHEVWSAENKKTETIAQNKEKEQNVANYVKEYGVKKTESKKSDKLSAAQQNVEKNKTKFHSTRDSILQQCKHTYVSAIKMRLEKAGKNFEDGNYLKAYANGLHAIYNMTGFNLAEDAVINWFRTDGIEDIVNMIADYSYTAQAETVRSICSEFEVTNLDAQIEELKSLGEKIDAAQFDVSLLKKTEGYGDDIYEHCVKQKNGQYACVQFVVNEEENKIMSIAGASAGCMPLPFKLYEARSCLFCPLFKVIFNAVQSASSSAWDKVAKPLSTLVLIGLAIWIAWMVLLNVSSMTKQDAPKFLNDLFKASFKVIIIYFLLSSSTLIYHNIIGPLLKAGFEFGTSFLSVSGAMGTLPSCKGLGNIGASIGGVLPQYVYQHLLCFIEAVQYELATSQAIGSSLMCISVNQGKTNLGSFAKVMPDFSMMFQGALIYGISFILSISFGFYLIDATVQLGIFGVVLPFLLLCYPFKITKKYFDTGVGVFMNSWFIYVFMGIVVNICMQLIGQGLTGGKGGFEKIEAAINGNHVSELQAILDIGFAGFLILIACCLFAWNIMGKVEEIAGKFSGGGLGLKIGNQIGTPALSAAVGIGKEGVQQGYKHVVKPGVGIAGKAIKGTVKGGAAVVRHPVMTMRGAKRALTSKSGFKMLMRGQFRRLGSK